jgi:hypothetical protein
MCVEVGLVWGKELYFDATKIEANASLDSMRSRSLVESRFEEHLAEIFPQTEVCGPPKLKARRRSLLWERLAQTEGDPRPHQCGATSVDCQLRTSAAGGGSMGIQANGGS